MLLQNILLQHVLLQTILYIAATSESVIHAKILVHCTSLIIMDDFNHSLRLRRFSPLKTALKAFKQEDFSDNSK